VCPCIASTIVNDDQQDAIILVYLFIPNQLYMFRAMSSPIVTSTWLYLQLVSMTTSRQQYRWKISEKIKISFEIAIIIN